MARVRERLHREGFETRYSAEPAGAFDGRLVVRGHGTSQVFATRERAVPPVSAEWVQVVVPVHNASRPSPAPLVVAPDIDAVVADQMWSSGVSWIDGRGRGHLRFPGLAVELDPLAVEEPRPARTRPPRHGERAAPTAALTPTGLSVSLLALLDPLLLASPLRELADRLPASLGTVQSAVADLERSGYASRTGGLLEPRRLLDAWTSAYLKSYATWHSSERYDCGFSVDDVRDALTESNLPPAWLTGEAAAEAMDLPLRAMTVTVYADETDRAAVRKALRLRRTDSENRSLASPFWSPTVISPPYAPAPVIRADLIASGDPVRSRSSRSWSSVIP
ncbi:MAG: type IV toxin-antitoxin system AbiEi family antitoxin, partial [Dermatophilaceae bacterium]